MKGLPCFQVARTYTLSYYRSLEGVTYVRIRSHALQTEYLYRISEYGVSFVPTEDTALFCRQHTTNVPAASVPSVHRAWARAATASVLISEGAIGED